MVSCANNLEHHHKLLCMHACVRVLSCLQVDGEYARASAVGGGAEEASGTMAIVESG